MLYQMCFMGLMMLAALCAYFVKGLCGFANTLVFSTILSFGIDNIHISPVELLLGYPANVILAWQGRKAMDWKICLPLAVLVLLGSFPRILLLKNADTSVIKVLFGLVIMCIAGEMFLRERAQEKAPASRLVLGIIGVVSGILCGLYGIGALLAAYMSRVTEDNQSFKANLSVVFIAENTFRIAIYWFTNIITWQTAAQAIMLIPAMLVGLAAGIRSGRVLDEKIVKRLVIVLLMFSGGMLVIGQLVF